MNEIPPADIDDETPPRCPTCDGRGDIKRHPLQHNFDPDVLQCPTCLGDGYVWILED